MELFFSFPAQWTVMIWEPGVQSGRASSPQDLRILPQNGQMRGLRGGGSQVLFGALEAGALRGRDRCLVLCATPRLCVIVAIEAVGVNAKAAVANRMLL